MHNTEQESHPGIVGAGLVGSLLSIYLAKRGISSRIYERRPDMRRERIEAGRSINLAVSTRGLHALKEVGLEADILQKSVPMRGRMIHTPSGELIFQPYGLQESDCIYSISRGELNQRLMTLAEETQRVQIQFNQRVEAIDLESGTLSLRNDKTQELTQVSHPTLFATDGSASVVRHEMAARSSYQCTQDYLEYGYKELAIPAGPGGSFQLEKNALHIWPRGNYMLIALPNFDGSFTCTLFLDHLGPLSFESLDSNEKVSQFFQNQFPDVIRLIPNLTETFFSNPTGSMVTVKCSPWYYSDKVLLLGDAAHAIVPFFGQGMNCGFEDCSTLNSLLDENPTNWKKIFPIFYEKRKQNADCIADMAVENFAEMRDKVKDARFQMEKAVEKILQLEFPDEYVSRYALVTFSRVPYHVAYEAGVIENEILTDLCEGIQNASEIDRNKAAQLIRAKLSPLLNDKQRSN